MNTSNSKPGTIVPQKPAGVILIWEPVVVFRQALIKLLQSRGLKTISITTAAEASQALSKYSVNIRALLLGIQLENAVNIVKKLKTIAAFKNIPVIILSNRSEREVVVKCLQAGAKDFIVKPGVLNASVLKVIFQKILKVINPEQFKKSQPKTGLEQKETAFLAEAESPAEKVQALIENVSSLLALPYAVSKIIELYSRSGSSAGDFEKPMKSDPAITAAILRRANSITMASRSEVTSLKQAVARIGINETRNIAAAFAVFKLFPKTEKTLGFNRIEFWSHSLTVGICTNVLALIFQFKKSEDCFFAGLLHDIGKMILDDYLNEEFQKAIEKSFLNKTPVHVEEKKIFEIDHSEIGGRVAEKWKFPEHICRAISNHHQFDPDESENSAINFDTLVYAGNQMEKALQIGSGGHYIIEEEGLGFWKKLAKKNINWKSTIQNINVLVKDYASILKIPKHYFDLTIPQKQAGSAAVFAPQSNGYEPLIQMMLVKMGFDSMVFSSEKDLLDAAGSYSMIIADLSKMTAQQINEFLDKITPHCIVLTSDDSVDNAVKLPLDFSELRVKAEKLIDMIAASSIKDIWDFQQVKAKTGNNEKLFKKRIISFQESIPPKFHKLKKAILDENYISTARLASIMIIEAKDFSAGRLAAAAGGLEKTAKDKNKALCIKYFNLIQKELVELLKISKDKVKG